MIELLPKTVKMSNNKIYEIRSDYRVILRIISAFSDETLTISELVLITLTLFYVNLNEIDDVTEAYQLMINFINCNDETDEENKSAQPKLFDWEQDSQIIFSAINHTAGKEVRAVDYLHWWTFLGYFNEIGECTFSTYVNIRRKKAKHKKLDKSEREYYKENKSKIDLKRKLSDRDKLEIEAINNLFS